MKYPFSTMMFCMIVIMLFCALPQSANANVYAAQLKILNADGQTPFDGDFNDGTGAALTFYLNDAASGVLVEVLDTQSGSVIFQTNTGAVARGFVNVPWNGSGTITGGRYAMRVTATQDNYSTTSWTMFWDSGDVDIFTRGVAINSDQTDADFGKIFTANDGGPLGTGINIYNPDGSNHNPFLVAADVSSGGTVSYGSDAPIFTVMDPQGRLFVSLKDFGQIMRINRDYSTQVLVDGLTSPKGLYLEGQGAGLTIYVAADQQILRANIGTQDSVDVGVFEVVGSFSGFYPHQIVRDNDGALYATLRISNDLGGDGRGLRKWDISGTLPVTDNDALWFLGEDRTFIANDLYLDSGSDPASSADDILYYCTRAGGGNDQDGIWRIDDINSFFPDTVRIITEQDLYGADDNINARSTFDFDAAGNIVLMENSNEHIFFITPPGSGSTNSFTTTGADTVTVTVALGIEDDEILASEYRLEGNYPNPFNPSTTIRYRIARAGFTTLTIFNSLGKEVRTLVSGRQTAGQHTTAWDGRDNSGKPVASGMYIMTLRSGSFSESQRLTLLK